MKQQQQQQKERKRKNYVQTTNRSTWKQPISNIHSYCNIKSIKYIPCRFARRPRNALHCVFCHILYWRMVCSVLRRITRAPTLAYFGGPDCRTYSCLRGRAEFAWVRVVNAKHILFEFKTHHIANCNSISFPLCFFLVPAPFCRPQNLFLVAVALFLVAIRKRPQSAMNGQTNERKGQRGKHEREKQ